MVNNVKKLLKLSTIARVLYYNIIESHKRFTSQAAKNKLQVEDDKSSRGSSTKLLCTANGGRHNSDNYWVRLLF